MTLDLLREPIEFQIGNAQYVVPFDRRAAQERLDAHQQLGEIEGLCQVIVGAAPEVHDLALDPTARRQHKTRKRGGRRAPPPQEFRTAQLWKHQIEYEQ